MAYSVDWITKVISVPTSDLSLISGTQYALYLDAFRIECRRLEATEGLWADQILAHTDTRVNFAGATYAPFDEVINGYTVELTGIATRVDLIGSNNNIIDIFIPSGVSVVPSNSAGLIGSLAIEFGEYGGGVTFDPIKGVNGTVYPIGTQRQPSSNLSDVNTILQARGFKRVFIIGDVTLSSQDFSEGITFEGQNSAVASVKLLDAANINNCEFKNLSVSGVADDSNVFRECSIGDISSLDGYLDHCGLSGTITLGGVAQTTIVDCFSLVAGSNTPTINIGSGSALAVRGYQGGIELVGKTGTDKTSIDVTSGQVVIGAGNTSGEIILRGSGIFRGTSEGTYIIDQMLHGSKVDSIRQVIELQRPHHTGMGKIIYWDPYAGDDTNAGDHLDRGVKTFAQAQVLATDNGHDIIIGVTGDPTGITTSNENIVITKSYLFLRSTGRDFRIISTDDTKPAIDIQADGIEISSLVAGTSTTNLEDAIHVTGSFPLLKDLYIEDSSNGIHVVDGEFGIIENVRVSHGSGHGIKVAGNSEHFSIVDSHIGSNAGGGVIIDLSTGHEVSVINTIVHGNTGYGIDISGTSTGILIDKTVTMYGNSLGAVNDLGTGTVDLHDTASDIATTVWADPIATTLVSDVAFVKGIEGGRWIIDESVNQMVFYAEDNVTEIARFDLKDKSGLPTYIDVFERVRA